MLHQYISIHLNAVLLSAQFVYVMLGVPACITQIYALSTDAMMFRKFQGSVRNLNQSFPI